MARLGHWAAQAPPAMQDPETKELSRWAQEQLGLLTKALASNTHTQYEMLHVEPEKPREGMTVVADGSDWDPGSGAGQYTYINGEWVPSSSARLYFNVKFYGAKGDGVTDDTAAIQAAAVAANAAGGGIVYFPAGRYLISATITLPYSNVHVLGEGMGVSTVTTNSVLDPMFSFYSGGSLTHGGISDLTIDANVSVVAVFLQGFTTGAYARRVEILDNGKYGILFQIVDNFDISDNIITRTTAINTENHAILVTNAGQNTHGIIARNVCNKCNIEADGQYLRVESNEVFDWKYGGGITEGPSTFTHDNVVRGNITHGGTGVDADSTRVSGIEVWGARTVISDNVSFNNSGDGISYGSLNATVTGNICYDNGTSGAGASSAQAGIHANDGGAGQNSLGSIINGNRCYDSGGGNQKYGFAADGSVNQFVLGPNNFTGNNTADTNFTAASGIHAWLATATWTPTITSTTGTITSVTTDSARWQRADRFVHFSLAFHITTNGTGAGKIRFTLPTTAAQNGTGNGFNTGTGEQVYVDISGANGDILKYNAVYPGSSGNFFFVTGMYETV